MVDMEDIIPIIGIVIGVIIFIVISGIFFIFPVMRILAVLISLSIFATLTFLLLGFLEFFKADGTIGIRLFIAGFLAPILNNFIVVFLFEGLPLGQVLSIYPMALIDSVGLGIAVVVGWIVQIIFTKAITGGK